MLLMKHNHYMKSQKLISIILSAAICLSFSACNQGSAGNTQTESVTQAAEVQAITIDSTDIPDYNSEVFGSVKLADSFVQLGNTYRIKTKLEKLAAGETVNIAFLGGSITEGIGGTPEECYAKHTFNYIAEKYGGTANYINAGISGTPSILGNLRVKRDVLDKGADIVVIEYAVNDGGEKMYQESYDSLLQTILSHENEPAVILLFNRTKEGHSAQDYMKRLGEYYELPMVSATDALTPALDSGALEWSAYSNDSSHPNLDGHKLLAAMIEYYFLAADAAEKDGEYVLKSEGLYAAPYKNALMAERDYDNSDSRLQITSEGCFSAQTSAAPGFTNGWKYDSSAGSEPMTFTATGNSLFIICKRNNSAAMGKLEVCIDGKRAKVINTNDSAGWGDPYAYQVIKWQSTREMNVEICPAEGNEDKTIEILAVGVTDNP